MPITEKEVEFDKRTAYCKAVSDGERTLYVCSDKDGTIWIREKGFAPLRWGNPTAALLTARRELSPPSTAYEPGCFDRVSKPVTFERNRRK